MKSENLSSDLDRIIVPTMGESISQASVGQILAPTGTVVEEDA